MKNKFFLISVIASLSVLCGNGNGIKNNDQIVRSPLMASTSNSANWYNECLYSDVISYDCKSGDKKVGYYVGALKLYRCNSSSEGNLSLFTVALESWFVPGNIAAQLYPNSGYDSGQHHTQCAIEIKANKLSANLLSYQFAAPQNDTFQEHTITSNFSAGFTYGRAEKGAIALNNASAEVGTSQAFSFNIGYLDSYTVTQPTMNAQPLPGTSCLDFKWLFSFDNKSTPKDNTFHVITTYCFEVKKNSAEPIFNLYVKSDMTEHGYWTWDTISSSRYLSKDIYY